MFASRPKTINAARSRRESSRCSLTDFLDVVDHRLALSLRECWPTGPAGRSPSSDRGSATTASRPTPSTISRNTRVRKRQDQQAPQSAQSAQAAEAEDPQQRQQQQQQQLARLVEQVPEHDPSAISVPLGPSALQPNSLYSMIVRVQDVDPSPAIADQRPRIEQFARTVGPASPNCPAIAPVEREFLHAVVAELADVDVASPSSTRS